MTSTFRCTIVIPCHNEAQRLRVDTFRRFLAAHPEVRLLFVDDGSSDGTARVLKGFKVLRLRQNRGKAEAVRAGVLHLLQAETPPDVIGFLDADLATPLEEAWRLIGRLREKPTLKLVFGARWMHWGGQVRRSPWRLFTGRVMAWMIRRVLKRPIYDSQCGAKFFRREVAKTLFAAPFISRWLFDVELLLRLRGAAEEVPLRTWREVGESKVGFGAMFKAPFELWRILCYAHDHRHIRETHHESLDY